MRTARPPAAAPLDAFFRHGGGTSVAIAEGAGGGLSLWTEAGPNHAAWLQLDNNDPTNRLSWRETLIAELRNVYPVGALSLTGTWSQLQSSGSGLGGSYTGNRAISTTSAAVDATVTVDRPETYDIWVHFTRRTNGGYLKVEIDGAQALVTEIDDPAGLGFKAIATYGAVDLQRRQTVKVATGLAGPHDVRLSFGGIASPGGNAIMLEAVSITGSLSDPQILPPLWQPSTTYAMGDEVQMGGIFYSARANGQSGTNGPTHGNGIASDGALDWRADNRPTYPEFVAIDYASEREYAARFDVDGAVTEVGGQTHGNELLSSRVIAVDGVPWVPVTTGSGLSVGQDITLTEITTWQTQSGTDVASCQLQRHLTAGGMCHNVTVTGLGPVVGMEWLYAGMLPMVHWDGESQTTVVAQLAAPEATVVTLADYAGTNPANIAFAGTTRLGLTAAVRGAALTCGLEAGTLPVAGNQLGAFDAFLRPNLDARTASGSMDWGAKAYVAVQSPAALTLGNGDTLAFFNRHVFAVT